MTEQQITDLYRLCDLHIHCFDDHVFDALDEMMLNREPLERADPWLYEKILDVACEYGDEIGINPEEVEPEEVVLYMNEDEDDLDDEED